MTFLSRILYLLFLAGFTLTAMCQDDVLTKDFDKLSAKERARIASKEQADSRADGAYQALMAQAEEDFRSGLYEASMAKFNEARILRPYNVYPKVKIKDLEVLIKKRDEAAESEELKQEVEVVAPAGTVLIVEEPQEVEVLPIEAAKPVERTKAPEKVMSKPPAKGPVSTPVQKTIAAPQSAEEGERVYREGRSVVVESRLWRNGRIVVFRKVSHPWGEVNYFRDGLTIPPHIYVDAMNGE